MSDKKQDGRIKYTKMVLRDSLIALMREKPIAKVTVTEICQGADINRATFYAHYADPFALLSSIENEMMLDITEKLGDAFSLEDTDLPAILARVFEYIKENSVVCSVLLSDMSDTGFQAQVVAMLAKQFIVEWTTIKSISREDAEYLYTYAAIGCVGLIRKWLTEGMKKTPESMAELVMKLSNRGYSAF
ncbi:MAG: TetR-like C-terminal domain-containing protein [Oscillospiraceae bacterium]